MTTLRLLTLSLLYTYRAPATERAHWVEYQSLEVEVLALILVGVALTLSSWGLIVDVTGRYNDIAFLIALEADNITYKHRDADKILAFFFNLKDNFPAFFSLKSLHLCA